MGTRDRMEPLTRALTHVKKFDVAVDVGAHAGRISKDLAKTFKAVFAFEPIESNRLAWRQRMREYPNAELFPVAVGLFDGHCRMEGPGNSKYFYAAPDPDGPVEMVSLDSCNIQNVDFLKIDCEGGDTAVIAGAKETILRCRPVIVVESIPEHEIRYGLEPGAPLRLLEQLGAKMIERVHVDHIFVFPRED